MSFFAVENVKPHRDGSRVTVTWDDVAGSDAMLYHVWLDGIYLGKSMQRRLVFYGDGTHHVRILGADTKSEIIDSADPDLRPDVPAVRPILRWERPLAASGGADTNIQRFDIYQGDRAGGAVDETGELLSVDVLSDSEWNFVAVMDALKHGESRRFKIVTVAKDGTSDVAAAGDILRSINCHSPEMVVQSGVYDSGTATLTLIAAEITH